MLHIATSSLNGSSLHSHLLCQARCLRETLLHAAHFYQALAGRHDASEVDFLFCSSLFCMCPASKALPQPANPATKSCTTQSNAVGNHYHADAMQRPVFFQCIC